MTRVMIQLRAPAFSAVLSAAGFDGRVPFSGSARLIVGTRARVNSRMPLPEWPWRAAAWGAAVGRVGATALERDTDRARALR